MTPGPISRAVRLGALALSVIAVAAPATVLAAGSGEMSELVVTDPLPGYTHSPGSALDGPIDVAALMKMNGADESDIPDFAHNFTGQARTWQNSAGSVAAVMVIDCGDEHSAANFVGGALDAQTEANAVSFEPELDGALGFTVHQPAAVVHTVIWRQGRYFVEVFGAIAGSTGSTQQDAKSLAQRQADFLRDIVDAEPTVGGWHARDPDEKDPAYRAGQVIGTLLVPGIVVFLIVRHYRRKARRTAPPPPRPISFLPPPTLPAGSPLPPPMRVPSLD